MTVTAGTRICGIPSCSRALSQMVLAAVRPRAYAPVVLGLEDRPGPESGSPAGGGFRPPVSFPPGHALLARWASRDSRPSLRLSGPTRCKRLQRA